MKTRVQEPPHIVLRATLASDGQLLPNIVRLIFGERLKAGLYRVRKWVRVCSPALSAARASGSCLRRLGSRLRRFQTIAGLDLDYVEFQRTVLPNHGRMKFVAIGADGFRFDTVGGVPLQSVPRGLPLRRGEHCSLLCFQLPEKSGNGPSPAKPNSAIDINSEPQWDQIRRIPSPRRRAYSTKCSRRSRT
jgi:hypothetical protein